MSDSTCQTLDCTSIAPHVKQETREVVPSYTHMPSTDSKDNLSSLSEFDVGSVTALIQPVHSEKDR